MIWLRNSDAKSYHGYGLSYNFNSPLIAWVQLGCDFVAKVDLWFGGGTCLDCYNTLLQYSGGSRISRGGGGGRGLPRQLRFENLYVKMKESGPLGGGVRRASANVDPPMTIGILKPRMNRKGGLIRTLQKLYSTRHINTFCDVQTSLLSYLQNKVILFNYGN